MAPGDDLEIVQLSRPTEADQELRQELTACWVAVTNAGGAAGFPFPPVDVGHVAPVVDALAGRLDPDRIGSALMRRLREVARDEMRLERLHLAVRGGIGLEAFYSRLGWQVVGRWPGKLRLAPTTPVTRS